MNDRIVVIGGGVGGLASALALSRAGHAVTLVERDPLPPFAGVEEAFAADRRGAPQVHQTHGFLARFVLLLEERFPDIYRALLDLGCEPIALTRGLGDAQDGDDRLKVLVVRRTTFELVLRQAMLDQPGIELVTGVGVAGLEVDADGPRPRVTGVRLEDGTALEAGAVVAATGRRSVLPAWFGVHGIAVDEEVHESGLMYLSRWYRHAPDFSLPDEPKLHGDLRYLKYLGIPGDGGTFSVTLAVRIADAELRGLLSDPTTFDEACLHLDGPSLFFRGGPVEPLTGVLPMGGLVNRLRRFADGEGQPLVEGFHAVGDAHTCTNPLYGRGCSLALLQAVALTDAFAAHPDDPVARAVAYEAVSAREVEPWYHASVEMDRAGADPGTPDGEPRAAPAAGNRLAAVFAASADDPVLARGLVRMMNLLATPADLMADPAFVARSMEVIADPERYPIPDVPGPTRDELITSLRSLAA